MRSADRGAAGVGLGFGSSPPPTCPSPLASRLPSLLPPRGLPPHLWGRGGFQLPGPQLPLMLRAKVIQKVIPVTVLPPLRQLQRQARAVPTALRTSPDTTPPVASRPHTRPPGLSEGEQPKRADGPSTLSHPRPEPGRWTPETRPSLEQCQAAGTSVPLSQIGSIPQCQGSHRIPPATHTPGSRAVPPAGRCWYSPPGSEWLRPPPGSGRPFHLSATSQATINKNVRAVSGAGPG